MRYLFLVQGEGRGHMTQAISLYNLLIKNNHEVVKVLVGKSERRVIPDFFYKNIPVPVESYESPNFVMDNSNKGIRIRATISYNMLRFRRYFRSLRFLRNEIKQLQPDVIVNFYELLGGLHFLFHRPAIKHVCLGHQFLIFHPDFEFPKGQVVDRILLKINTKVSSIRANAKLALSFTEKQDLPGKKIYVTPPLLREEVLRMVPEQGDYILSYILNDGYKAELASWQKQHPDTILHFFSDMKSDKEEMEVQPNMTWHRINDKTFLEYMRKCKAFASTSGFESVCEAMYLGKPILMVPTGGHFEQQCNAIDASKAGAGIASTSFDLSKLLEFIPSYKTDNSSYKKWLAKAEDLFLKHLTSF